MSDKVFSLHDQRRPQMDPRGAYGAGETRLHHPRSDVLSVLRSGDFAEEIGRCVPRGVDFDVDRYLRIVQTIYSENDRLCACDAASVLGATMKCAELGLVPGTALGHAHIAATQARNGAAGGCEYEATLIPGYRGLITLAMRSGEIESITSRIVTDNEISQGRFDIYYEGDKDTLVHRPILIGDKGTPALVYCIVRFKNGSFHLEPMTRDEVVSIRDAAVARSPWRKEDNAWVTHETDMWRKTPVRRAAKFLDVQVEALHAAIALDEGMEIARPQRLQNVWTAAMARSGNPGGTGSGEPSGA